MELLVYTRLFREKFQKESFSSENDLLLCVLEGAFEVRRQTEWIRVEKNQAFLFCKGVQYERRILAPLTMALFRYNGSRSLFPREHLIFHDTWRFQSTLALCEKCKDFQGGLGRMARLLWDLSLQYEIEAENEAGQKKKDEEMLRAEKRLRSCIAKEISITDLAKECSLSHVQLIRRFRAAFGCTPSEYMTTLRLDRARELLLQTDLPIKAVATECGFNNEYYFSNFFKKHTDLSPTAFRSMTQ